jgi:hypothetical protein
MFVIFVGFYFSWVYFYFLVVTEEQICILLHFRRRHILSKQQWRSMCGAPEMEGVRQDGGGRRWRFPVCPDPDVLFLTFKVKIKIK